MSDSPVYVIANIHIHVSRLNGVSASFDDPEASADMNPDAPVIEALPIPVALLAQHERAVEVVEAGLSSADDGRERGLVPLAHCATATLYNGMGRYEAAFAAAQRACEHDDVGIVVWALAELVEASARTRIYDVAAAAQRRLERRARECGADWALGVAARSRALLSTREDAEVFYKEACELLADGPALHAARAQLVYGEWLRREHRRVDAREHLWRAHEAFVELGLEPFVERARRELAATCETVRKRAVGTPDELTAEEAQIAQLASDGRTNPEIGAELFISPRTVEWHLRKVFAKLGIRSRRELAVALPGARWADSA